MKNVLLIFSGIDTQKTKVDYKMSVPQVLFLGLDYCYVESKRIYTYGVLSSNVLISYASYTVMPTYDTCERRVA